MDEEVKDLLHKILRTLENIQDDTRMELERQRGELEEIKYILKAIRDQ